MVTPLMSMTRRGGENRRGNLKYTPVGTTIISPAESLSPIDTRMTPIRKSLFQRKRVTSNRRRKETFVINVEEEGDSRDDSNEIENLRSANKKKDGHLKLLHERFTNIQKGLGSIDEERNQLVEKAKRLDKEKKLIQKQLELREREILTLIKRCASQEEKMRESSKLRATNRDLQKHLDLMAQKLEVIEQETEDRQSLKKLLQDSELEREQLRDRLAKIQKEHDAIADTLQECLGNIRQLTEEKHAIEEERQRERKRAEIELENQRLAHIKDSNSLKEKMQEHQGRILQMESILQDKIKSNTDLRREKAVMSQGKQEEIREVVEKYERQLKELRNEIEETIKEKKKESQYDAQTFEKEVSLMKEKLKSKDAMIQDLEIEFSDQMEKLISKQSSLDESEEERRDLELKVESSKKLEIEHAALLDFVEILDSNLAELTTANAHLELEKDELLAETEELRKKANILQTQLSSLHNNQKAKERDFRELLSAENDELQIELQDSLRKSKAEIESLQAELERGNERISKLETDLHQARKVIADKEEEIIRILNEMDNLSSNLGADLKRARLQAAHFEAEVFAKNQTLASLEGRLEGAKAMRTMGKNVEQGSSSNANEKDEIQYLREQLQSKETDSKNIQTELEKTIQEVRNEAMFLQQKIESISEEKAIIEKEVEESRSLINDRDEQIIEVQRMVLKHKKRAHELERKQQHKDNREKPPTIDAENLEDDEVDTKSQSKNYQQLEERILELEKELMEAQISRSESAANLAEAHKRIEKLEKQLIGEDTDTKTLENQLRSATKDLLDEESKACILENEYHSTTKLQTEREDYSEETRSRISTLEKKIEEMKRQSNDLDIQIQESRRENATKDKMVASLQVDLAEGKEAAKELRSELQIKCTEMENLKLLLGQKDKDLKMRIETTNDSLRIKEDRISELENLVSSNGDYVKSLQDSLSKAKDDIVKLEDQIRCEKDARMILEEQLSEVASTTAKTKAPEEDFLPSSDTHDLKQKIQGLLTRQAELTTELDKANAVLEEERKSWIEKEHNSYEELSIQKGHLLVLQNVLKERERVISSLQKGEKEGQNQKIITESQLSEYKNTISKLEQEVKSKEEKIDELKRQNTKRKEDGIQYAFVESDSRRLQVEDELAVARKNLKESTTTSKVLEQQLDEVQEALENTQHKVLEKDKKILSAEKRNKVLEGKVQSLDEKLRGKKDQCLKLNNEIKSMKSEMKEKEDIIDNFNASTQSLKEAAEKASNEMNRKNDIVANLTESADNLKLDLQHARDDIRAKGDKINCLENSLNAEKESLMKLKDEIAKMQECASESEKVKDDLMKELESTVEEDLWEARKALEALKHSSGERISSLESRISDLSAELTRKDIEMRELRLAGLMGAIDADAPFKKEVDSLKAEALKKDLEHELQIEKLKSELNALSLKTNGEDEEDSSKKMIESLISSKVELELNLKRSNVEISRRDATIKELNEALLQDKKGKEEICNQREAQQKAESESRDEIENMKMEYEEAAARDKEVMEIKLRHKDALHKEELESALAELESTLKKLEDSEILLAERGSRLGEMVDHNRDIELELEKEQTKCLQIEDKFIQEQNKFETANTDLKKVRAELRRKESVLESKLKEERNQREYTEESLRIAQNKYKEAIKTKRNVTELERENKELKDKIQRQEAYLQRKLQKEKNDRARSTPGKSVVSPRTSVLRTPTKRTPTQRNTNSVSKQIPRSSTLSRSKLQAPSTIGRGISTSIPSVTKSRSKISPSDASCRSVRTKGSVFSRSTTLQTPSKQASTLSARDILQSELDDDRSAASELSSILRSPNKAKNSSDAKVQDWELEPRE